MSEIMTYTKKMFDPLHPAADSIDIEDIAHALSLMCRANGHFRSFYSVGQHSINCMKEAKARNYSIKVQLGCLLHDASEAYLSDITRPVKEELPKYREIENVLQNAIWNKWLGEPLTKEESDQIFDIDDVILAYEFLHFMDEEITVPISELKSAPVFDYAGFEACQMEFTLLFNSLTDSIAERISS